MLLFKKGSRDNEASVVVFVKSGTPPSVLIRPIAATKVNPTDILIIESLIISKKTVNATWSCVQSEGSFLTETKLTLYLVLSVTNCSS